MNLTGVVCHHGSNGFAYNIYLANNYFNNKPLPIEVLVDKIADSGKWNDNEIVLLSCNTGVGGVLSPAQEIADAMCCMVWAPRGVLWLNKNGTFYINEDKIYDIDSEVLTPEYQKQYWEYFLLITY